MEQITPLHVTNHYRRNISDYEEISERLERTRETFMQSDTSQQIRMLQKSHSFAVISVQTPVHIHEESFNKMWSENKPIENLENALERVNYRNKKAEYIRHSLTHSHLWADVVDLIEAGEIDKAHKYVLDTFKGVGPAKAPFTFSMLGFTEKMCIDANVVRAMGLEKHVTTRVVDKYEKVCQQIRDKMPTLRDTVSPFMWQWIVFDWQRGEISKHKGFYKILGTLKE